MHGLIEPEADIAESYVAQETAPELPHYLKDNYWWAYLHPRGMRVFDHSFVVSSILWGNYRRLRDAALAEIEPGARVLQPACVYGDFSIALADRVGPEGLLDVQDVAPVQVRNGRKKLAGRPWARVLLADAADGANYGAAQYDQICCFFLLHELPDDEKALVVNALLGHLPIGGKAVFVDYHLARPWHPLRPLMMLVFSLLEPFAKSLVRNGIPQLAAERDDYTWSKTTYFGGLYQKVTAVRKN